MAKIRFNNQIFQADKVIKTNTNIIGQDLNGNEIFSFRGISDFAGFQLQDDSGKVIDFLPLEKTEVETLKEQVEKLNIIIANMLKI